MNVQASWVDNSTSSLDYVDPGFISAGRKVGQIMHSAAVATYLGLTPDRCVQAVDATSKHGISSFAQVVMSSGLWG
jgi:hypothetical protein